MTVGWKRTYPGILRKALVRRSRIGHWSKSYSVRRTFELPEMPRTLKRGEVWAIFLVKNEIDILGHTLQHALSQDIDRVLVVDNGSTDGTLEMVQEMARTAPILVGIDREPAYYQSIKMTFLARWASARGAEWIVPMDADEFWFARDATVGSFLRSTADDMVIARLHNLFPTVEQPQATGLGGRLRFDHARHVLGKTALRGHPMAWLSMGNHEGLRPGMTGQGLFIAHVPWRSLEQYENKVRQGSEALAATHLEKHVGGHWRRLGAESKDVLRAGWEKILRGVPDDRDGWNPRGPFSIVEAGSWRRWTPPVLETSPGGRERGNSV